MVILRRYSFVTGGQFAMESVAGMLWNQWPEWRGICNQKLDFRKVTQLEPIPKFKLTKGNLTKSEKEKIRKKIKERLSQRKAAQGSKNFTPPKYDENYFQGMRILEEENNYS